MSSPTDQTAAAPSPLATRIAAATARAIDAGAILPLDSEIVPVDDGRFAFEASWISSLSLKDLAAAIAAGGPQAPNPFLPPEAALVVEDLGTEHLLLLNKFPLEDGHVMAITRAFRDQQTLLGADDWTAIATILAEIDCLVMFNGGRAAGASQDHRHIHFMPKAKAPLEPLFLEAAANARNVEGFGFRHVLIRLGEDGTATALHHAFDTACGELDLVGAGDDRSPAYNVLMTRRWMLIVPRSRAAFEQDGVSIPLAAVHFGGSIMVRDRDQLDLVRGVGLEAVLRAGGVAR